MEMQGESALVRLGSAASLADAADRADLGRLKERVDLARSRRGEVAPRVEAVLDHIGNLSALTHLELVERVTQLGGEIGKLAKNQSNGNLAGADVPLILDFVSQAAGQLARAEAAVWELANALPRGDFGAVRQLLKSLGAVKGPAEFLGLEGMYSVASPAMELVRGAAVRGALLNPSIVQLLMDSVDSLRGMAMVLRECVCANQNPPEQVGAEELAMRLRRALGDLNGKAYPD